MNAAAYGNSISDNLIDVEAVDMQTLKLIKLSKKQCEFSYRKVFSEKVTWLFYLRDFVCKRKYFKNRA